MPVVLAFKEEGGFEILDSLLEYLSQKLTSEADTSPENAALTKCYFFTVKKILDLYALLVNGVNVMDSTGSFSWFNSSPESHRNSERRDPLRSTVFLYELRKSILPVITTLWNSTLVEKKLGSGRVHSPLSRVIEIMRLIGRGEHEMEPSDDMVRFFFFWFFSSPSCPMISAKLFPTTGAILSFPKHSFRGYAIQLENACHAN